MKKYIYKIFEVSRRFLEPKLNTKFRGGVVTDIIGGIEDERLVVVGYEVAEDEDGQKITPSIRPSEKYDLYWPWGVPR